MNDFLLVFRADNSPATTEEMKNVSAGFMDWMQEIIDAGKLADRGHRLTNDGKVVRSGGLITDGPYTDIKESLGGYSMIRADSYEDAVAIARRCPLLLHDVNGSVEVREVFVLP